MQALYDLFLKRVPPGGSILDAGCGSGRDSKYFAEHGYQVTAVDASAKYAEEAGRRTGIPVVVLELSDLDFDSVFDGIWASASLLHVPRVELPDVLNRLARALNPKGVTYMSFKEGPGERFDEHGRYFNDMTEEMLREYVSNVPGLRAERTWIAESRVRTTETKWLYALLVRD